MSESEPATRDPDAPTPTADAASAADTTTRARVLRGGVELASLEAREQRCLELLGDGAVVVRVPAPKRELRGRLAAFVSDSIEARLTSLGAPGPHPHTGDLLGDQLFRARTLGAGLVLSLDSLAEIRSPALTPEDSHTLTGLARATRERPLVLLLDDADRDAPAYARPVPLGALLAPTLVATLPAPPVAARDERESAPAAHAVGDDVDADRRAIALPKTPREAARRDEPREGAPRVPEAVAVHARALSSARGPQPLAVLKRLFLEHYLPLGTLLDEGHIDARAEAAHTTFRRSFERAYADAFPTFALTGKRPRMVFDAFEEATRLARATGARTTSLLMVPSLRVDLGLRMDRELQPSIPSEARVESGLLFAALPSTSARQEDTLARGVAALAAARPDESPADPEWHTRGALRRVRLGSRDLYSLETVAAWRSMPRGPEDAAEVVSALATAIARHAHALVGRKGPLTNERSPERTLLFVFGDHGFTYEDRGHTCDGGSTPEEAIAPYFAYVLDPAN
ncbi:MAG: hypothetical protein IPF92_05840 [Myxococcales bacterium]|jgi:hypothetical protein|nr:hypothetical protein [Myxococcales bacterium]MBL0198091.1 hypothetical protein [Myxococcales bacterium]HQY64238.1 hypothetical protein [Polyangiaceae bacterium]